MSQNSSHMHTEPAWTILLQSYLGSWFTIGFHSRGEEEGGGGCCCWEQSLRFQIVLWWTTLYCCLARENRSPWEKVNKRTKYRESLREPLNLTGLKKSGCSGRYFLLFDLLELSSFFPTGGSGLVCTITSGIMPTVYYSFFSGRKTVWRGKKWLEIRLVITMIRMENNFGCIHLNSMLFY